MYARMARAKVGRDVQVHAVHAVELGQPARGRRISLALAHDASAFVSPLLPGLWGVVRSPAALLGFNVPACLVTHAREHMQCA